MRQKMKGNAIFILAFAPAFALSTIIFGTAAFAQDVVAGGKIAKMWCSGCHLIDRADRLLQMMLLHRSCP
jgi:mono/diheme cytochrome c family protein